MTPCGFPQDLNGLCACPKKGKSEKGPVRSMRKVYGITDVIAYVTGLLKKQKNITEFVEKSGVTFQGVAFI